MPLYLVCAVFLPPPPNLFISLPLSVDQFCLFTIPFFALFVHRSKTIFKCITRTTEYCNQHHLHHTIKYYIFSLLFSSSTRTPRLCRFSPMCNILSSHLDLSTCTPFLSLSLCLSSIGFTSHLISRCHILLFQPGKYPETEIV